MQLAQFRRVLHIVCIDLWVFLFHVGGVVAVLIDEHGPAVMVEGFPEKGLWGEAKYEEVAWRRALSEDIGDLLELRVGHVE